MYAYLQSKCYSCCRWKYAYLQSNYYSCCRWKYAYLQSNCYSCCRWKYAYLQLNCYSCCRWKYAAGFVVWPRKNRWPVFCQQGTSSACAKLKELITHHTALTALIDDPPHEPGGTLVNADADENVCLSASEPSQIEQELAACKEDIVNLVQAM